MFILFLKSVEIEFLIVKLVVRNKNGEKKYEIQKTIYKQMLCRHYINAVDIYACADCLTKSSSTESNQSTLS